MPIADRPSLVFDALLDKTILPSYLRIGYLLRQRMWRAADTSVDMTGRTCLVTGANAGLGLATAERLAALGASVIMVARNRARGERAQAQILAHTGRAAVRLEVADLSDLTAVRDLAGSLSQSAERLDVLIHNAGVMLPRRALSQDGIEKSLATNVVGPFLLTALLLPLLERSTPARIIFVSSAGMYARKLQVDDLQSQYGPYNGAIAYARQKRAQVILSELWAERLSGSGITVNAMHPGWVDTPGLRRSLPTLRRVLGPLLRTPAQGADTIVWLSVAPHLEHESGKFWFDRRPRETHKLARTKSSAQERRRLWGACVELSGRSGAQVRQAALRSRGAVQ